jgi:hypothetical protein
MRKSHAVLAAVGVVSCASVAALGQAVTAFGPRANNFPDVVVSAVGNRGQGGIDYYGSSGGLSSYAIASDSCNIGTHAAIWINEGTYQNQHPVIGGAIYRVFNGRIEQIGISWLKHGFCAADSCSSGGCGNISAPPTGTCQTDLGASGGGCDWLGYGRATDTYSASLNGGQGYLGPRSEVNPWTGVYPHPWINNGNNPISCLNKRLLVRKNDLNPANYPGAQYFGEVVYIMTDEWPGQRMNNYSHRKIAVGALSSGGSCSPSEQGYSLDFPAANATIPLKPAIEAWKTIDPTVKLVNVDVPNDGRYVVGSKVTDRGDGTWNYDYAIMNLNSDRGAQSFTISKTSSPAVVATFPSNHFKGVEYHSGETYSLKPWANKNETNSLSWETDPWSADQKANALRWSTLYNFRVIVNRAPTTGNATLGLFKPGVQTGDPTSVQIVGIDIPSMPTCRVDYDNNGSVSLDDVFQFINGWFAQAPAADYDNSTTFTIDDIFQFINAWFTGC